MSETNGYSNMSERGRTILEYMELCIRARLLGRRAGYHPSLKKVPAELLKEIEERRARLPDFEQAAIADFFGGGQISRVWPSWVKSHLAAYPQDAQPLWAFERDYNAVWFEHGGLFFPWRMNHRW